MEKIKLESLIDSIYQIKTDKKPVMIAIDGPSGAGKSSFSKKLSKILTNSFIIEMDDFITWNSLDIGLKRALNQLFEPLSHQGTATYQARDWIGDYFGDGLGDWKEVPNSEFVIVEGLSSSRLEFSKYFNLSIWVEASEEICIQRGLDRDGADLIDHWKSFKIMENDFFLKDQIKSRVDYIVDSLTENIYKS